MLYRIKLLLLNILGTKRYLRLVSKVFFVLYDSALLKTSRSFDCHYMAESMVKPGDYIIDIGANLGYFSRIFSKKTGPTGKVLSVEPVQLYRDVLTANIGLNANVTILPFALGEEEGKEITMGIPSENIFRHGLTRVFNDNDLENDSYTVRYQTTMRNPSILFAELPRLDYIKCDVEGYELVVMQAMLPVIARFKPTLQIETWDIQPMIDLLTPLGYTPHVVYKDSLLPLSSGKQSDLVFIPA